VQDGGGPTGTFRIAASLAGQHGDALRVEMVLRDGAGAKADIDTAREKAHLIFDISISITFKR